MTKHQASHLRSSSGLLLALCAAFTTAGALSGLAASEYVISQKGREFRPTAISIAVGDTLVIMNDDGDLRHHAYIDAKNFRFDSGDQEPGSRSPITFSAAGEFEVLCAIHPKMRLLVHVR
jgi:plastocyanin